MIKVHFTKRDVKEFASRCNPAKTSAEGFVSFDFDGKVLGTENDPSLDPLWTELRNRAYRETASSWPRILKEGEESVINHLRFAMSELQREETKEVAKRIADSIPFGAIEHQFDGNKNVETACDSSVRKLNKFVSLEWARVRSLTCFSQYLSDLKSFPEELQTAKWLVAQYWDPADTRLSMALDEAQEKIKALPEPKSEDDEYPSHILSFEERTKLSDRSFEAYMYVAFLRARLSSIIHKIAFHKKEAEKAAKSGDPYARFLLDRL